MPRAGYIDGDSFDISSTLREVPNSPHAILQSFIPAAVKFRLADGHFPWSRENGATDMN